MPFNSNSCGRPSAPRCRGSCRVVRETGDDWNRRADPLAGIDEEAVARAIAAANLWPEAYAQMSEPERNIHRVCARAALTEIRRQIRGAT